MNSLFSGKTGGITLETFISYVLPLSSREKTFIQLGLPLKCKNHSFYLDNIKSRVHFAQLQITLLIVSTVLVPLAIQLPVKHLPPGVQTQLQEKTVLDHLEPPQ